MPGMTPQDLFELRWAGEPRVSPDGRSVAFVVSEVDREGNAYRASIWLVPADGSAEPRRLTFGPKRDSAPRWSPDGTRLAFVSDREGDTPQLYVLPVDGGGEALRLTDLKEGPEQVVWSPDGTRLAFSARVPDAAHDEKEEAKREPRRLKRLQYKLDNEGWTVDRPHHLFVVPADGSAAAQQITDGDFEDVAPAWSPDGRRVAFASARHDRWDTSFVSDVYVVPAEGGEPERVTPGDGTCEGPSWSPDGTRIAHRFTPGAAEWDLPRHTQIAVWDLAAGARRVLTESLDRNCGPYPDAREPIWSGEELLFAAEEGGNTPLYTVPADGSAAPRPVLQGVALAGYDLAGGVLAHGVSTPTMPAEVFVGDRRLSRVTEAFTGGRELGAPERFTAVSPDGTEVEAWIIRPAGFDPSKRYPALLNVHGGPFTQYGNRFFDEFQVYAGAGYAVVYSNPRGSSGYSEEWGRAIRGGGTDGTGWGSVDYDDVMAVMDEAIKRFQFIDPDRLGVMGGSYGGYMASWVVGHTDRFAVAISERACNNFVSMWGSSDFGWDFKGYFGSFMFEDPEPYVRMSPITYAKKITTPLLILHSENDLRCPIEQGEQLFVTLRLLGRDVEMVRFPDECHELTRSGHPAHRVRRFEIVLDWLRERLG